MKPSTDQPRRLQLSGIGRVWILTAFIALGAVMLTVTVWEWDSVGGPIDIPWWGVAIGVYVTELTVVHLRFRRDAHTVSMSELAVVTGLFLASPVALILGQAIGNLVALALNRRQTVLKLAFNLGQFSFVAALEVVVFRSIARSGSPVEAMSWLGAVLATLTAMLVSNVLINAAIRLVGGHLKRGEISEVLLLSTLASALNTGLALVGVAVLWTAPQAFILAMIPPIALFVAYRAYVSQREERARLESLYRATRMLHESPQIEGALTAAVKHARAMFDAELVEVAIFAPHEGSAYRTTMAGGDELEVMEMVALETVATVWREHANRPMAVIIQPDDLESVSGRPIKDAVVAPLHLSEGVSGILMAANRLGDVDTFAESDVKLLETLARQVSVSLENGRLEDSLAALTDLKEEMRHRANHDSLTQLANRALFIETVGEKLEAVTDEGTLAVLFVDLDDFKAVNDTFGHAAGDQLLVAVGQRLSSVCRPGDVVARFGGDEFAVLITQKKGESGAEAVAQRIITELSAPFSVGGQQIATHASIGIAYGKGDQSTEEVLREADAAMYAAKRAGKSRFRVFAPGMREELSAKLELRTELEAALADNQIDVVYQPIVSFRTGEITGVEALARWFHPERGVILPAEFIPFAEETGLINQLGKWVLRRAVTQAAEWNNRFPGKPLKMSVNLSPVQLVDGQFVGEVKRILTETAMEPEKLILEITENVLMQTSTHTLQDLKKLGVRLAIDDFGTGYSSLSYLDRLPIDVVKVDKSFVDRLEDGDSPLVRTVLQIGEALGVETVVEGVESANQIAILQTIGCDQGQGFYFAAPLPSDEVETLIAAHLEVSSDRKASPHLRLVG